MLGISFALFVMAIGAGLVAGFVGGYRLGVIRNAIMAALLLLPSTCMLAGLWILLALFGVPVLGFLLGLVLGIMTAIMSLGRLFCGASGLLVRDEPSLPTATLVRCNGRSSSLLHAPRGRAAAEYPRFLS